MNGRVDSNGFEGSWDSVGEKSWSWASQAEGHGRGFGEVKVRPALRALQGWPAILWNVAETHSSVSHWHYLSHKELPVPRTPLHVAAGDVVMQRPGSLGSFQSIFKGCSSFRAPPGPPEAADPRGLNHMAGQPPPAQSCLAGFLYPKRAPRQPSCKQHSVSGSVCREPGLRLCV